MLRVPASLATSLALFLPGVASAATLNVGPTRTYATITAAINASNAGDTIQVDAGLYRESLTISQDLIFIGVGGSASTEIRGTNTAIAIRDAAVEFHGFEVTNTTTGQGFNVDNGATVLLDDVFVHDQDNTGTVVGGGAFGGGVYVHNSQIEIVDCVFDRNQAREAGGHLFVIGDSSATVTASQFLDGKAGAGGAIGVLQSTLTVDGSTFDGNLSSSTGGAIQGNGASATVVSNSTFTNNQTAGGNAGAGGAGAFTESGTRATFVDSTFLANSARTNGGALYGSGVTLSTDGDVFESNQAGNDGVAVHVAGSGAYASLGDTFRYQGAGNGHFGGGIFAAGQVTVTVDGATFLENAANRGGAIAYVGGSNLSVLDSTFDTNSAVARGGAIDYAPTSGSLSSALVISGGRFVGNLVTATNNTSNGGAVYGTVGNVNIAGTDFTDNRASYGGAVFGSLLTTFTAAGATFCANDATAGSGGAVNVQAMAGRVDVHNVVFAENTATSQGGGMFLGAAPNTAVVNNTFAGNRATTNGGAVYYSTANVAFKNNIVRGSGGNGVSANVLGSPSLTYSDWYTNTPAHTGDALAAFALNATNLVGIDPGLGVWSQDGDCTNDDFRPRFNAPVVNAGDPALQDPDKSRSDIGAFGGPFANQALYVDADGDTFFALFDCDDSDKQVYPGAAEYCNGLDDDCDSLIDEIGAVDAKTVFADADGDGFGNGAMSTIACAANGYVVDKTDCNDAVASINPGAPEVCNLRDDDCDGNADEAPATGEQTWFTDGDGDGFGDPTTALVACFAPAGAVLSGNDCDDALATVHPGAAEVCNLRDDDCDGTVDVGVASGVTVYLDADGDGYGDAKGVVIACSLQAGYAAGPGDCDDGNASVSPGAAERCDGVDDDCDGLVDESAVDAASWYVDVDGDGFGDDTTVSLACAQPLGRVALGGDCKDVDAAYHPGATESCSGAQDFNCDGSVGSADADGDGFQACNDCDDADKTVNANGVEVCDGRDNNCNGLFDEPGATDAVEWYADVDADGYGDAATGQVGCAAPSGFVAVDGDCDDRDAGFHPNAFESCSSGLDNNCDGSTGRVDADGDGTFACEECDDSDPAVYPGADELCDGLDNDCDGALDEDGALFGPAWYADADGDGFGNADASQQSCGAPDGHVADGTDCDDQNALANPDAPEIWYDGEDEACDGGSDDDHDGDGRDALVAGGQDCDDRDPTVYAGAEDLAGDGVDQDCSGADGPVVVDDIVVRGGCNCDTNNPSPVYAPWVLLAGLFLRRRAR